MIVFPRLPVLKAACLIASISLMACTPTTTPSKTPSTEQRAVQVAEPGIKSVDIASVIPIFEDLCINTSPSFRRTAAEATKYGMIQSEKTGTFFHQTLNLSVNIRNGKCSMVFASNEDPGVLAVGLAIATAASVKSDTEISVDPITGTASTKARGGKIMTLNPLPPIKGKKYYRAAIGG